MNLKQISKIDDKLKKKEKNPDEYLKNEEATDLGKTCKKYFHGQFDFMTADCADLPLRRKAHGLQ